MAATMIQDATSEERDCGRGWVLITGASRGIGAAIAERLWNAGFGVILWARDRNALATRAAEIAPTDERIRWASADVGDPDQVSAALAQTLPPGTSLSGVVLNAGHGRWRPITEIDLGDWNYTLTGNLTGAFITLKAVLPRLDYTVLPVVLGILSDSALYTFPNRGAYASAKSGFAALLDTVRREYRAHGVRVCQIYPSRVDTHFAGNHDVAQPGMRADGLSANQVADTVRWVFENPSTVEIRRLYLSSIKVTFGLEEERFSDAY
ncbi:MAG: SDR family oxidoreductase [Geminicoccaceae bacterium]